MDDLLTHLAWATRLASQEWGWALAGALVLYWVWYRNATSSLPASRSRPARRSFGG
jgi:hypothetical protein